MARQEPAQPHGSAVETDALAHPVASAADSGPAVPALASDVPAATAATAASAPPPDHGRHAYLVLAACSLAQAPIWGYSLAFGIFQQYYSAHSLRAASPAAITSVGTTQTGVMYLAVPVVLAVLTRFPRTRAWCGPLGVVLAVAGLAGSSAAPADVPALITTQGALYALGCALLFGPASLCLNEWFVARKGFALGVMWASKGGVGVGMPLLTTALLRRFGLATTLQAWAVASVLMALPGLIVLRKPRVAGPPSLPAGAGADTDNDVADTAIATASPSSPPLAFLKRPLFWLLMAGNTIQSLGYQIPNSYIASYSTALFDGASGSGATPPLGPFTGAIMLTLLYCGSVPGAVVMGMLSDRLSATTVVLISSTGSVVSVFGLWYVVNAIATATTAASPPAPFALLVVFVLVYGFFAGGFSSTWSAVQHAMQRRDPATDTGHVFGLLMGGRGLGFLLSGPVSGSLLSAATTAAAAAAAAPSAAAATTTAAVVSPAIVVTASAVASSAVTAMDIASAASFKPLIICTGTTATLGAVGALWSLGKPCRHLGRRTLVLARRLHDKMQRQ